MNRSASSFRAAALTSGSNIDVAVSIARCLQPARGTDGHTDRRIRESLSRLATSHLSPFPGTKDVCCYESTITKHTLRKPDTSQAPCYTPCNS